MRMPLDFEFIRPLRIALGFRTSTRQPEAQLIRSNKPPTATPIAADCSFRCVENGYSRCSYGAHEHVSVAYRLRMMRLDSVRVALAHARIDSPQSLNFNVGFSSIVPSSRTTT